MPGQFSDTGSRYALEALTGRSALMLSSATGLTFTAASEPAANSATPVAFTGRMTITTSTSNGFAGLLPGMTVILTNNTTAAANVAYTVASVSPNFNQISITTNPTVGTGGTLYWNPSVKPTYLALCTAQPLDNNYAAGINQETPLLNMQEYGATGYSRISVAWNAASAANTGTATYFVGNGTINGQSTTAATQLTTNTTTIGTGGAATATATGTTGNPANTATITITGVAAHTLSAGMTVTLSGFTAAAGATGVLNATYTVTGTPSPTTFTVTTATGANAPSGSFTGGTVATGGVLGTTYTLYTAGAGTGTIAAVGTNPFPVGSTVNIKGVTTSSGSLDCTNATVVAATQDGTNSTITVVGETVGVSTAPTALTGTATTANVLPNTIMQGATGTIASTSLRYTTYVMANTFAAGDTVLISGITGATAFNGVRQVYAANSTQFTVFEPTAITSNSGIGGTYNISRVGAAVVGPSISGPTTTQTFGPFTAATGSTVTHAALVTSPSANLVINGITTATPAANYAQVTTTAAHGLFAGQVVRITGTSVAGYNNGVYTILSTPSTTTFIIASTLGSATGGAVSGVLNGEVLAWWQLDSARTPAVNDSVSVATNALSLYVN